MGIVCLIIFSLLSIAALILGNLPGEYKIKAKVRNSGIIVAVILLLFNVGERISDYTNYSYARVNKEGRILKSKNWHYHISKYKNPNEEGPLYIIDEKFGYDDLNVISKKGTTPKLSQRSDGVGIQFYSVGFLSPTIETDFTLEKNR